MNFICINDNLLEYNLEGTVSISPLLRGMGNEITTNACVFLQWPPYTTE